MYRCRVVGHATSTVKHPSMKGCKLLLVKALQKDGRSIEGDPILAVDRLGAGRGDLVSVTSDGIFTRQLVGAANSPVRWSVIAIEDE